MDCHRCLPERKIYSEVWSGKRIETYYHKIYERLRFFFFFGTILKIDLPLFYTSTFFETGYHNTFFFFTRKMHLLADIWRGKRT